MHTHTNTTRIHTQVPLAAGLSDLLASGLVEYTFFTGRPRYRDLFRTSAQWWAYNDCVSRFRHRHRWLAFIDADEFIVLHDAGPSLRHQLPSFLERYDEHGGLAINWVVFGSSGHAARPAGGVLVNYVSCLQPQQEQNAHVKVIANTRDLMTVGDDPHRVYYTNSNVATVNEAGIPVRSSGQCLARHCRMQQQGLNAWW